MNRFVVIVVVVVVVVVLLVVEIVDGNEGAAFGAAVRSVCRNAGIIVNVSCQGCSSQCRGGGGG